MTVGLNHYFTLTLAGAAIFFGCAPQRPYRSVPPPVADAPPTARVPPPPAAPPPSEPSRTPMPQEGKISEQDLKRAPALSGSAKDGGRDSSLAPDTLGPPLPDNSSLIAKITPGISPQRAASLRLTEEGRKSLDTGDAPKAVTQLEKTIVIDSTNPYGYFYLAKAQNRLGRYKESLNFLDVAESRLGGDPFWLAEIFALRGENFRALGMIDKAQSSYAQALRLNSGNRTASDGLGRLVPSETSASPR
jgi:hypothetical protein